MTTTTAPAENRYYAHAGHRQRILDAAEKINRRLAATGTNTAPLSLTITPTVVTDADGEQWDVLEVTYSLEVVSGDWAVAGIVTPTADGDDFTYRGLSLERDDLNVSDLRWCDHCQARRVRKHLFVITDAAGHRMQVGSTCMEPHTGMRATKGLLSILGGTPEALFAGIDMVTGDQLDDQGHLPSGGRIGQYVLPTDDVLALAAGLYPQWQALPPRSPLGGSFTGYVRGEFRAEGGRESYPAEDRETAAQVRAWVAAQDQTSDYIRNATAALGSTHTGERHLGLVASLIPAHEKALARVEREAAAEAFPVVQEPWAAAGTKLKDSPVEVTLERQATFETAFTYYGELNYVHTFRTDAGHVLVWKTQRNLTAAPEGIVTVDDDVRIGARLRLTSGTVKAADEYRGDVQAPLSRVKYEVLAQGPLED